jgi:hypothetical protein
MAAPTNAFKTTAAVGNREDLSDLIKMVAQEQTPVYSGTVAGEDTDATATYHEWQTDTLGNVDTANYQPEGNDFNAAAISATTRVGNRLQILSKEFVITGTQEAVSKAGRKSEVKREMKKKMKELARDIESFLVGNQASDSADPRKLGGLESWLTTNGGSQGGFSAGATTAATDGTQRDFTEALLASAHQTCADNGATPSVLMLGSFNRRRFNNFTGGATATRDASGEKFFANVKVYDGPYGSLKVVWNPRQRDRTAFLLDPEAIRVAYLRRPFQDDPAKTGDSVKKAYRTELTLQVDSERAHGVIADLTTS